MKTEQQFRSSTARLALAYGAVVLLLVIALQGTVFLMAREALRNETRTVVAAELESLTEDFNNGGVAELVTVLQSRVDSWGRLGAVYLLADESLQPLAGNLTAWPVDVSPANDKEVEFRIDAKDGAGYTSHPVRARMWLLQPNYWLLVGTDTSETQRSRRGFGIATAWGVALLTALIWLLGWRYSRHTVKRVRDISATCDSIVHSDLSQRLEVGKRRDEFDQLASTVNDMLDRIEQQAVLLRATFGSIAHDLRTPLFRLRVRLEEALLRDDVSRASLDSITPALGELDRVQRTLGTLLEIARAESGDMARAQDEVDLSTLAREMHELYQPGMQERGLRLELDLAPTAPVAGQRQLLAQLIANLLENALKYVPTGGKVWLTVTSDQSSTTLVVADNGPGIAAADRERAQQPFVRLQGESGSEGQAGSGLGLSLVRAISRLHRGEVRLLDNHPGLRVECVFPRLGR